MITRLLAIVVTLLTVTFTSAANAVYLNVDNISVSLGASMTAEPFANQTAAISLANVIDAPSAVAGEDHISPTTHVWVSGGTLELDFDFGEEYDLSMLHFWNYFSEGFDVDEIDFTFYDSDGSFVGELLDVEPELGGAGGNPIFAEDYALSFPSEVQFVNAVLSGTNGEVDFNNIGFTAELSNPLPGVPLPASIWLFGTALIGFIGIARRRRVA